MKIQNLSPAPSSTRPAKRIGRGTGSGHGKTSGKGHKGQNARSGGGVRPGFEGGQMPLIRKVPKRGFTNIWKKEYTVVNIDTLEKFDNGTVISADFLKKNGTISKIEEYGLKVIGRGKLTKALTVQASKFSESAIKKIQEAGGKIEVV